MYLAELKTLLVVALRDVFDTNYPEADFRETHVGIEWPDEEAHYPAIWVDFEPTGPLEIAGVDHHEVHTDPITGDLHQGTRWRFKGLATYTIVALKSLERDRLFDELVKTLAFGTENPERAGFRRMIEDNDLIACNFSFDRITQSGTAASPGTPWGTDEIVYEVTLSMECVGEFVSDDAAGALIALSEIVTYPYTELEGDPRPGVGWV